MSDLVELDVDNTVATIRLNKPQALNALCAVLSSQVLDCFDQVAEDKRVRAVILTGAGRGFCAGSDLVAEVPVKGLLSSERGDLLLSRYYNPIIDKIHNFPKPVIVAVNGVAAGGGVGLALSGDIVLMKQSAQLHMNFAPKLGLVPDLGSSWFLTRAIGRAKTLGIALTGAVITARQAEDWGLIWQAIADEEFDTEVQKLADQISSGPLESFRAIRTMVDAAGDNDLSSQLELERKFQLEMMAGENFAEGIAAFKEKRLPSFPQ